MSVVGETFGVIACVAGIVSAYHDGSATIQKIKIKRAQQEVLSPPRLLEESVSQAPLEIEREKQRGVARFGRAFEEGDHVAVITLQQITTHLQANLLEKLRHAVVEGERKLTDFIHLVDAADLGRDRTIATMLELRQRLLEAKPIVEIASPTDIPNASAGRTVLRSVHELSSSPVGAQVEQSQQEPTPSSPSASQHHRTWTREYSTSTIATVEQDNDTSPGADDVSIPQQRKRSSFLHFLKPHRGHSASDVKSSANVSPPFHGQVARNPSTSTATLAVRPSPQYSDAETSTVPTGSKPSPTPQQQQQHQQHQRQQSPPQQARSKYQEWVDDPVEIWESKPSFERRETVSIAPDATQPANSPQALQPIATQRTSSSTMSIPTPTPENEYLGFCKGAWKLQNGDRKGAFSRQREVDPWARTSAGGASSFLTCSHSRCAFRSHINYDLIWDKAWTVQSKRLKFRWAFLANSHVTQRVVVKNQYSFQCIFCTFLGEKGKLYNGVDHYLSHVSADHRGQRMSDVLLYKTNCINDRIGAEDDAFDINLWPFSAEERQERGKPDGTLGDELLLSDPLTRRSTTAADSMFSSDEPWNEGLSDFQYHSKHDLVEFA